MSKVILELDLAVYLSGITVVQRGLIVGRSAITSYSVLLVDENRTVLARLRWIYLTPQEADLANHMMSVQ